MQTKAFGYAGRKIWLIKRRVSGCMKEAFGCLESNSNAQESIQILKGAAEAIRILMKLSGYWKIVFGCLQLQDHEQ